LRCLKIRHFFEIYFPGGFWKSKGNNKSKDNNFVASPFGLRFGLRQSGSAFRRDFVVVLEASRLIRKATARQTDPPFDSFQGRLFGDDGKKCNRFVASRAALMAWLKGVPFRSGERKKIKAVRAWREYPTLSR